VRGGKAYSSRASRSRLRRRRIVAVIPEPSDQIAHRKRRGSRGGRPPVFDAEDYKRRNVIERGSPICQTRPSGLSGRREPGPGSVVDEIGPVTAPAEPG
jgi:hypothetical protein